MRNKLAILMASALACVQCPGADAGAEKAEREAVSGIQTRAETSQRPRSSDAADPIDNLVSRYNATYGLWKNGEYPIIELPPDAKPEEVLDQAIQKWEFDQGHIRSYKIKEIRELTKLKTGEHEPPYRAALIESDLGTKIFLFRPEGNNQWWVRFCDVPQEKQNKTPEATR